MKRIHKRILLAAAIVCAAALGCVWLAFTVFGVVTDAVDRTLGGPKTVKAAADQAGDGSTTGSRPPADRPGEGPTKSSEPAADSSAAGTGISQKASDTGAAPTAAPVSAGPASDQAPNATTDNREVGQEKGRGKESEESLGDMGGILSFFLNDGDTEALNPEAILNPSNKTAAAPDADGLGGLLQMIPGADSPTLRAFGEGKYRGREADVVDDAIEDPKVWRLVFSLGGGM